MITVGFKRLIDAATIPTKAHPTDSGFDLYASEDVIVEPGETVVIPTGIAVKLPPGYEAQVRPRSGVTSRTKIRVQLGTIDQEYTGEIGVIVDNISGTNFNPTTYEFLSVDDELLGSDVVYPGRYYEIKSGDRIAQLVIQPLPAVESYEIDGELVETGRDTGGFGSTGMRSRNEWKDAFDAMVKSAKANNGGYLH